MDMTKGDIRRNILLFILPLALGNLLQQFYNITDIVILGRYAGPDALAAVGAVTIMTYVFNAVVFGLKTGVAIVCSTHFGEKDYAKVKSTVTTGTAVLVVVGSISTVAGTVYCDDILRLLHTPENLFQDAAVYLKIYICGLFFVYIFNFCSGIFQALGESKKPFIILLICTVINVILDIVFVRYIGMGVAGTAVSTVIAQAVSSIVAVVMLFSRFTQIAKTEKYKWFDLTILNNIFYIGLPSIVQQGIVSFGVIIVQSFINRCGPDTIAGVTIASKIEGIVTLPILTIGEAVSVFTAQNMGAGKPERIKAGVGTALRLDYLMSTVLFVITMIAGRKIISIILKEQSTGEILDAGMEYLFMMGIGMYFMSINQTIGGAFRGFQKMGPFLLSFACNIAVRVVSVNLLYQYMDRIGVFLANPVSFLAGSVVAVCFYKNIINGHRIIFQQNTEKVRFL